jgi:hypothetical protein
MYLPLNIAKKDSRETDESGRSESMWRGRGELRKGEPLRRRQSHTPSESPESKRGDKLGSASE